MNSSRLRGILCMLLGVAFFAIMDLALKILVAHYPPIQVSALRGLVALPFVMIAVAHQRGFGDLLKARLGLHALRAGLGVIMLVTFTYALKELSLSDTYAIFFVAPLLITALSVPLLHEKVDAHRWGAIIVGLLGVLVVLNPTGNNWASWSAAAALFCAFCYALAAISVRVLARTDSSLAMNFWFTFLLSIAATTLAAPHWVALQFADWPWLLALGIFGALGQHFITEAFRRAPASVIAPFEYTALLWGLLADWFIWHSVASLLVLAGAAIIIASGVYVVMREGQHDAENKAI